MQNKSKLKKLASRLLATTCLTVAGGSMAVAGPFTGPYGTSSTTAVNVGLDTPITGTVTLNGPAAEWFEIEGLSGGVGLASVLTLQDVSGNDIGYTIEDDLGNIINTGGVSNPSFATLIGNVPVDGNVVVGIAATNEGASSWQATLTSTPEPGTIAAVGAGLLGVAALGLRRRKKS